MVEVVVKNEDFIFQFVYQRLMRRFYKTPISL